MDGKSRTGWAIMGAICAAGALIMICAGEVI